MKTQGMEHQLEALRRSEGREGFAFFMEQGTGKTWVYLAEAERLWLAGEIDSVLVEAPRGVHTNWVRREIPTHLECPVNAMAWRSGMGKIERAKFDKLLKADEMRLRVLTMNFEALLTKDGFAFADRFVRTSRCLIILDESQRIKSPDAARTIATFRLKPFSAFRREGTGSPITKQPADIFMQMEFLEEGLLGTTSYRAFVAEYAELENLSRVYDLMTRAQRDPRSLSPAEYMELDSVSWPMKKQLQANPRMRFSQIVSRHEDGTPKWRNLDKLKALLEPHSYRVLKKDCLDLPPKVYQTHYFDLSPAQARAYRLLEDELRIQLESGDVTTVAALAALVKLQQITSGFVIPERGADPIYMEEEATPRVRALLDWLEDIEGQGIIWVRFKEEIKTIAQALTDAKITFVEYHGGVKERDREEAIDSFQRGDRRIFLGQAQAGGTGLTLTAADWSYYFSQDFNRETRVQSEDRNHRIGTKGAERDGIEGKHVLYVDSVAANTIDEAVAVSHQRKADMAAAILGDRKLNVSAISDLETAIIEI